MHFKPKQQAIKITASSNNKSLDKVVARSQLFRQIAAVVAMC